ncbi:hypothetical protein GCM10025734_03420 [Kitasatospora paranensis]
MIISYFALGVWLNNQKSRRPNLTPGQLAQLAQHGVEWAWELNGATGGIRSPVRVWQQCALGYGEEATTAEVALEAAARAVGRRCRQWRTSLGACPTTPRPPDLGSPIRRAGRSSYRH